MTKVNGKAKGNSYERSVSNKLSERFAEYTGIEKSFRRNADSGSFFGASNQKRIAEYDTSKATFGDIITPDNFRYAIECKNYKTAPTFKSLVTDKVSQWDDWLKQASQDAVNSNKDMLLIIKYNNVEEVAFMKDFPSSDKIILTYNEYNLVKLHDLLSLTDSHFFL